MNLESPEQGPVRVSPLLSSSKLQECAKSGAGGPSGLANHAGAEALNAQT